jgi:hypothetical protein
MRIELRGKRWTLEGVERLPDGSHGEMDPVGVMKKAIRVARTQNHLDTLDTLIHECLHACIPDLCEEAVEESATDIAKVLYRLGCRVTLP